MADEEKYEISGSEQGGFLNAPTEEEEEGRERYWPQGVSLAHVYPQLMFHDDATVVANPKGLAQLYLGLEQAFETLAGEIDPEEIDPEELKRRSLPGDFFAEGVSGSSVTAALLHVAANEEKPPDFIERAARRLAEQEGFEGASSVFVNDGEGYNFLFYLLDSESMDHMRAPYTGDMAKERSSSSSANLYDMHTSGLPQDSAEERYREAEEKQKRQAEEKSSSAGESETEESKVDIPPRMNAGDSTIKQQPERQDCS